MAAILFPHQLFEDVPFQSGHIYLVEEFLFFRQYKFHQQKLVLHRASMKYYEHYLRQKGFKITYIESNSPQSDIRNLIFSLQPTEQLEYIDVTDYWLEQRIQQTAEKSGIQLKRYDNPAFLNTSEENDLFFNNRSTYFQTDYYIHQRKKHQILLDAQQKPLGGKWSYDADNRLKYPKNKLAPAINFPATSTYYQEAIEYVNKHFSDHYGTLSADFIYPTTHAESRAWLRQFLEERFVEFGVYEDAIVRNASILHHSVLTPLLNTGLITPKEVVVTTLSFCEQHDIPLNSTEGFIRQIIGWREFIRAIYEREGNRQRTRNFWGFKRKMPASFYTATTGITPIDQTIRKVLDTGYCHHIERLMVLGNFMLICEINPDEVYQWFMELFIDAYDWVMVPNIYGMSQFADGGLMCTKPYISGSNYLLKMSDYSKDAEWTSIWDALFWRFMHVHRTFFLQNPRLGMLIGTFDKMPKEKQALLLQTAENYLAQL